MELDDRGVYIVGQVCRLCLAERRVRLLLEIHHRLLPEVAQVTPAAVFSVAVVDRVRAPGWGVTRPSSWSNGSQDPLPTPVGDVVACWWIHAYRWSSERHERQYRRLPGRCGESAGHEPTVVGYALRAK